MLVAGAAVVFGSVQSASAYCPTTTKNTKWLDPTQTLHVRSTIPSAWQGQVAVALFAWNGIELALEYAAPHFNSSTTAAFELYVVDFSDQGLGTAPARTFLSTRGSPHARATVYMNSDWTWNTSGVMDNAAKKADVRNVLTHEFGHASGLDHPDDCDGIATTTERSGVMWATNALKYAPRSDDTQGIHYLYP